LNGVKKNISFFEYRPPPLSKTFTQSITIVLGRLFQNDGEDGKGRRNRCLSLDTFCRLVPTYAPDKGRGLIPALKLP